jgi:hypothetical protein
MAANGRQRTTDLAVCNRVGWEFGLGEVQDITSVNSAAAAVGWLPGLARVKAKAPVNRWCVYTGGIAQLDAAAPPRVLRWHEVDSITMTADNVDYMPRPGTACRSKGDPVSPAQRVQKRSSRQIRGPMAALSCTAKMNPMLR